MSVDASVNAHDKFVHSDENTATGVLAGGAPEGDTVWLMVLLVNALSVIVRVTVYVPPTA